MNFAYYKKFASSAKPLGQEKIVDVYGKSHLSLFLPYSVEKKQVKALFEKKRELVIRLDCGDSFGNIFTP